MHPLANIAAFLGCIAPTIAEQMPWFMPLLAVVTGGVFGSFLTCALYRLPQGLSLWQPPSYCPACHKTLRARDLVPLLSWVWFKGKCSQCGAKIPARYLLVEALSVAWALVAFYAAGGGFAFLWLYGAGAAFAVAATLQVRHKKQAPKSVAFGLLCLVFYVAFMQPLFACGGLFY